MKKKIVQTLCIVYRHPEILLGMKKRGFGAGRWNGFGGKVHPVKSPQSGVSASSGEFNGVNGESIEEAAKRELQEEIGIEAKKLEKVGIINFEFENSDEMPEVHFFQVKDWDSEPRESDEMRPEWFNIDKLPFDQMWPDDKYWMPLFLKGEKFQGRFLFDKSGNIVNYDLKVVEEI